jgi:hypothetical protein
MEARCRGLEEEVDGGGGWRRSAARASATALVLAPPWQRELGRHGEGGRAAAPAPPAPGHGHRPGMGRELALTGVEPLLPRGGAAVCAARAPWWRAGGRSSCPGRAEKEMAAGVAADGDRGGAPRVRGGDGREEGGERDPGGRVENKKKL